MVLIIFLWVMPLVILASKSWYHWKYLCEVDHTYRAYGSSHDFSNKMMNHHLPTLGGMGMNSFERFGNGAMGILIIPYFSKHSAFKHSSLAKFYIKVIHWHIIAFFLTVGLLISFYAWG